MPAQMGTFVSAGTLKGRRHPVLATAGYCLGFSFWMKCLSLPGVFEFAVFGLSLDYALLCDRSPFFLILFSPLFSLEAMSRPAVGTPLSLIGQTAAL